VEHAAGDALVFDVGKAAGDLAGRFGAGDRAAAEKRYSLRNSESIWSRSP
jgi:hypothetical protein